MSDTRPFTLHRLTDTEDAAAKHGFGELGETRFPNRDLATAQTGLSYQRLRPSARQAFGHRHEDAEEVYVVLSGSGRLKLDDEIVEVGELDAIRVSPAVTRCFEASSEGLELLVFGPRRDGDGEILPGWWSD
jgi:mannose-6-phosphate isomerase-like protein (cupin superfamily)